MPIYTTTDGRRFDLNDSLAEQFEREVSDATIEMYVDGRVADVPLSRKADFLAKYPNATTSYQQPSKVIKTAEFTSTPTASHAPEDFLDADLRDPAQVEQKQLEEREAEFKRDINRFGVDNIPSTQQPQQLAPVEQTQKTSLASLVPGPMGTINSLYRSGANTPTPEAEQPTIDDTDVYGEEVDTTDYAVGFGEGTKEGWKGLVAGTQYFGGELANAITGTSRDDWQALQELQRRYYEGESLMRDEVPGWKKAWMKYVNFNSLIPESAKKSYRQILESDNINSLINDALEAANGDVTQARKILAEQSLKETWGDRQIEAAGEKLETIRPTKGFGAWAGNLIPQMIPTAAALAAGFLTKNPKVAQTIGQFGMGVMTASTAGMSMKEARDAGATNGEVWAAGIADGVIEYVSEKIPFNIYTRKIAKNMATSTSSDIIRLLGDPKSPAKDELEKLVVETNKRLGGKLLSGRNVKEYLASVAAEGLSEFSAEALQTMTPIIYEDPKNYPTIWNALKNGVEGFKAGIFMGAIMGGGSKAMEHQQQRSRRKQQGYVAVAQIDTDNGSSVGEVVGEKEGKIIALVDGDFIEVAPENVGTVYEVPFEAFDKGVGEYEIEESYENGYTLQTPQEKNDAMTMKEEQRKRVIEIMHLPEDTDLDEYLGDDPLRTILMMEEGTTQGERQALLDYVNAASTVEGMFQAVRDDIDGKIAQSDAQVDSRISQTDGRIHPATMKQDDRAVYIMSGDVVLLDDGTIDTANSSESIIVKDAETGKMEFSDPASLLNVGEVEDAEQTKEALREQIRQSVAGQAEAEILGTLAFAQGDTYVLTDEEGVQHQAQIVADNGDGTVQVALDGATEAVQMPKEQVQAMNDATNRGRAAAYIEQQNAQRESAMQEVAEEQQPIEQPQVEESALSRIPTDENGNQLFEQAPAQDTWSALVELNEGDTTEATDTAQQMLDNAKKELDKATSVKPKGGATVAEIQQDKAERKARIAEAQQKVDYWTEVLNAQQAVQEQAAQEVAQTEEVAPVDEETQGAEVAEPVEQEISQEEQIAPQEVAEQTQPATEPTAQETQAEAVPTQEQTEQEEQKQRKQQRVRIKVKKDEEARRKPLRKRAQAWAKKVGVEAVIIERFEDVENESARKAIQMHEEQKSGQRIPGWYSGGKVYIYLPHATDISDLDQTYIHEVVAHHGMKQMLGEEGYKQFCLKVWDMMEQTLNERELNRWLAYPGVKGDKAKAADEYIAHLAETTDSLTELDQSVWDKIVELLRDALRQLGVTLEGDAVAFDPSVEFTNKLIVDALHASKRNLKQTAKTATTKEKTTTVKPTNNRSTSITTVSGVAIQAPVDMYKFTSKDKTHILSGVYFDSDGYIVASDGQFLAAIKADVQSADAGKSIAKNGKVIEGNFGWRVALLGKDAQVDDMVDFVSIYNYHKDANDAETAVRLSVGGQTIVLPLNQLNRLAGFQKAVGIGEIRVGNIGSGARIQINTGENIAVAMGVPDQLMYKWQIVEAATQTGEFGPIYEQFRGKPQEAIAFLLERKDGEAVGALSHPEIGEIDLVWGAEGTSNSDGYGLSKLVKYHPEVLDNLQELLSEMRVTQRSENRIQLESDTHKAAVRLTWNEKKKNWLLTAYEKQEASASIDKTTDTDDNPSDLRGDTALSQNANASEGKDTTISPKSKTPKAQKVSDPKIEDFGEKIGGARKDVARGRLRDTAKLSMKDLTTLKDPDKILSRKDIVKFMQEGLMTEQDAMTLMAMNAAARSKWTVRKGQILQKYRDVALQWERGEQVKVEVTDAEIDAYLADMNDSWRSQPNAREKAQAALLHSILVPFEAYHSTYEKLNYPSVYRNLKGTVIKEYHSGKYFVQSELGARRGMVFNSLQQAIDYVEKAYPVVSMELSKPKSGKADSSEKVGHLHVVKDSLYGYRIKSRSIPGNIFLSGRFKTKAEAEAYLQENAETLRSREEQMIFTLMGSDIGAVERSGVDYRQGRDITPEEFQSTFGFRGVEFGNWVPQAERQLYLNKTYDAIMDFCKVVGISPKAFSLGGQLALAFGSRGKSKAIAHYEPMKMAINLTRMNGAGSLAHEWFHALDNYLARQATGNALDMATDKRRAERDIVANTFSQLVRRMATLDYSTRSRKAGAYWNEVWERAARLFETYVYNELGGQQTISPLLVRETTLFDDTLVEDFGQAYPYPSAEENTIMKPYFDALFGALEERTDEQGNSILFRTVENDKARQFAIIERSNPMLDDYHTGIRSVEDIRTFDEAVAEARAAAEQGGWEELASYPDITNDMLEEAQQSGRITIYSSKPIANGTFVTPSLMQASDYAGGEEVYSKVVRTSDVAWINTDEGQMAASEDVRFRTTYHGTPAIFERFDHSFMGSGEGNQAFGWGTYVTEEKGIGEWYAKVLTAPINEFIPERRAIIDAQIELDKAEQFADSIREEIQSAKENIAFFEERIRNGASGYELEEAQENIENSKENILYNEQALTNAEAKIESARAAVAQAQEVYERARVRGNVYQVEIPDDNGHNYLSWEDRLTPKQMQMIASQAEKEGLTDIFYRDEDSGELVFNGSITSGEREYKDLVRSLGSDKAASEFLSRAGFTGIKYFGDGGNQDVHNYVIFNDADLEIKERTSFRTVPTFLSNAAVALEGIKQEKATPQQWLAMLKKAGGIKAGEDKWIGLSEWLEQSEAKTLTKQEVADFINENQIKIEEVAYGDVENNPRFIELQEEYKQLLEENDNNDERAFEEMVERYGEDFELAFSGYGNELHADTRFGDDAVAYFLEHHTINETRRTYTTDGLDNKREIALTVPTIESWNEGDLVHFGDAGEGRAIAWIRFGETTDEDGKRVLVIDEIQSKRHQDGREKGYLDSRYLKAKERYDRFHKEHPEIHKTYNDVLYGRMSMDEFELWKEQPKIKALVEENERLAQEYSKLRENANFNGVPEAPFEKNWAELAMKRMLRYAAEHGFDKVAWTKGDQQAERYSIGGVISKIGKNESNNIDEQNFEVGLAGAESMLYLTTDNDGKIIHSLASEYVGRTLTEVFGKELAVKMLNAKENTAIEGEGLRIGGEGMRAFYDQMLPSFMRKYAKKWGATVQDVTLPNVEEAGRTMHSVDVTDSMRESVMQGQTMFRVADPNRYMFIGEQGARRLDAVEEATTRLDNLEVAKEMEAANKGPRTIKMATGWERGADGKWRYETLDGIDTQAIANITEGEYTLEDFVSDESLFDAYPSLRGVKVIVEPNTGQDYGGYWDAANNTIALVNYNDGGEYEQLGIVHEIQHAIQRKEGFTMGINPKSAMPISEEKRRQIEALRTAITYTVHFGDVNLAAVIHDDKKYGGYIWSTLSQETKDILTQLAYGRKKMSNQEAFFVLNARWNKLIQKELVGEDRYRRQAGEVEARNSAARRGMGLEERRAFLASETEDVAREDQLFIYDNIGSKNTIGQTAQMLGQDLATRVNLVERIEDITDPNPKIQERKRKARGWYDTESGEVFVVLPNVKSGQEARRTVFHEVVGHKGMRETVGEKRYNAFLEKVYRGASQTIRERIARRAATLGWDFNLATDEYLASLAEQGFDERENRNFFEVVRDLFLDLLSDAKIALGYRINDNDIRYMLWRTYQMQRSKGAMGIAEDMVMQQTLGVGNFAPNDTQFRVASDAPITYDNFYESTEAVFTQVERPDRPADYVSRSGSEYWYGNDERGDYVIRGADHWSDVGKSQEAIEKKKALVEDAYIQRNDNKVISWRPRRYTSWDRYVDMRGSRRPVASCDWSIVVSDQDTRREHSVKRTTLYGKAYLSEMERIDNDDIRFRETTSPSDDVRMRVAHTPYRETLIRQQYEERIKSGMYQSMEAMQDSMQSLHDTMLMILKEEGYGDMYIEDVASFENAYIGENRLSSTNLAEANAFANTVFQRLVDAIAAIAPNEEARTELIDYMFAKHGLERNEKMAEREAKREYDQQESRIASKAISANGAKTMAELIAEKRQKDYAGLTALTGKKQVSDAEKEAQRMVEEYENSHETAEIWERVQEVRKAILSKLYEGGLMSEEQMKQILDMYDYYIPLRGFDEKTVTDQYAYLTSTGGSFSSPIRKAGGRESKADDPFANLSAMAESAILQANRNMLVKQRFLNFVLRHPSDLVSVNRLWLRYDETNQEWVPEMPNILETDSPDEVARKVAEHEQAMKELSKAHPDRYKVSGDQTSMPYKVPSKETLKEHQVIVKRNGVDYVLTINGSPRLAQALNGLTNPDNDISGAIGAVLDAAQWVNRALSAAYTTRNPDFLLSNFMRDMLYTNTMVWVKESPNYALAFHKNYLKANPAQMKILYSKYREGTLDMSDPMEAMFYKFIINGGETGYVNLKDVEQHKSELKEKLARSGGKLSVKEGLQILGDRLDGVNQAVENCARFAAFMTSQQMGRSVDRSIYDAKEISVNFNKKGAGSKFMGANGQTALGNTAAFTSGLGRAMYVFWNAAIQGTANFGRQAKRHPAKAFTAVASWFVLGALMAYLGYDDDDEDAKNSYFNNPEYVRRSNIMFHLGDGHYAKIPLPIEARAAYGLGELMVSVMSGKEDYSDGELASAIVGQMTQILPLDFMEGQGGFHAFIPSSVKPVTEIVSNTSWTGLPIYKDNPYNKDMPNWTKAYSGTNKYLVNLAATLNELSGGDKYTKGAIDLNPANIEYLLNGYFGGYFATADKLTKTAEMVVGARDFDPRGVLFLNRVLAKSDDRTQYRAVNNKYYEAKKEYETTKRRLRNYEHDTDEGIFNFAEKIDFLYNSEAYRRMELFDIYRGDIEDLEREIKEATSDEEKEALNAELMTLKSLTVDAIYGTEEEDDNDSR